MSNLSDEADMRVELIQPKDYEQVYALKKYAFSRDYVGTQLEDFKYWVNRCDVVGALRETGELMAQAMIFPLNMTLYRQNIKMGGIGFVATYPEYRHRGIMAKVISAALSTMRENGQLVSVLGPFSVSFYRQFGWEIFFDQIHYRVNHERFLLKKPNQEYVVKRLYLSELLSDDRLFDLVNKYYNQVNGEKHGMMKRNIEWWSRILNSDGDHSVVLLFRKNELTGYCRYYIHDLKITIQDFCAENFESKRELMSFICSHSSNVFEIEGFSSQIEHLDLLFSDPQYKKQIEQNFMFRIVDLENLLANLDRSGLGNRALVLKVEDEYAPWNQGVYEITATKVVRLTTVDSREHLELPINMLSAWLSGYLSLEECLDLQGIRKGGDFFNDWERLIGNRALPQFYELF